MRANHRRRAVAVLSALILFIAAPAWAHEHLPAGNLSLTVGWRNEPAYTGLQNEVDVEVADANNAPVTSTAGALTVDVTIGADRISLPLLPGEQPGRFSAPLLPTRPGTYSFHITGLLRDQPIDVTTTCSDTTFDCVHDPVDVQFPASPLPSAQDLGARLERETARVAAAQSDADSARRLALIAITVSAATLATAVVLAMLRRRGRA